MHGKRALHWFRLLLAPIVLASCAKSSSSTKQGAKRAEFASLYCALVKPCAAGATTPTECERAVTAALPPTFDEAAAKVSLEALRAAQSAAPSCEDPMGLAVAKAVPLDLPRAEGGTDVPTVLSVVLAADGTTQVDGKPVSSDDAILALAKASRENNPELRAVIKADTAVPHGRVIHVLDLLKQAQITKIAFGVSPISAPAASPSP